MNDVKKVLVVDDDIGIREIIKLILDDEGYEVNELDNGHQVDSAIACWVPDVILLDVMLGDMDGREICRHLKSEKNTAAIPIIIISATHSRYTLPKKIALPTIIISPDTAINFLFQSTLYLTHQRLTAGIYHGLKGSTFSPVNASALCLAKK